MLRDQLNAEYKTSYETSKPISEIGTKKLLELGDSFANFLQAKQVNYNSVEFANLSKQVEKPLHLTLYFDLNGTIMAGDAANGKSVDDSIWQMLCENYHSTWAPEQKQEMTFRDYIEKHLCPGDSKDQVLKKERQAWYKKFHAFLVKNNHPLQDEVLQQFNLIKVQMEKSSLFDSFIAFVAYLERNKSQYTYTIAFRTSGDDLPIVIQEFEKRTGIKVDGFAEFKEENLVLRNGPVLKTPQAMHDWINQHKVCAVRDHWGYWHQHNETYYFGKPFPFSKSSNATLELFFDDNVSKQILTAHPLYGDCATQQIQTRLKECGQIITVNTLHAATDPNYFINRLEFALQKKFPNGKYVDTQHKQVVLYQGHHTLFVPKEAVVLKNHLSPEFSGSNNVRNKSFS